MKVRPFSEIFPIISMYQVLPGHHELNLDKLYMTTVQTGEHDSAK